jgi:hypothetical protein
VPIAYIVSIRVRAEVRAIMEDRVKVKVKVKGKGKG